MGRHRHRHGLGEEGTGATTTMTTDDILLLLLLLLLLLAAPEVCDEATPHDSHSAVVVPRQLSTLPPRGWLAPTRHACLVCSVPGTNVHFRRSPIYFSKNPEFYFVLVRLFSWTQNNRHLPFSRMHPSQHRVARWDEQAAFRRPRARTLTHKVHVSRGVLNCRRGSALLTYYETRRFH